MWRRTMIYCVEDDRSIRELVIYALKSIGYEAIGFDKAEPFIKNWKISYPI